MLYCRKCSVSLKEVLSFSKRNKEKFLLCQNAEMKQSTEKLTKTTWILVEY